jgi:hypothetical protein
MILVPLFDLKFLIEFAAAMQELQIGGTRAFSRQGRGLRMRKNSWRN